MPQPYRSSHAGRGPGSARRELVRLLAIVLSIIALILTSSALNWVTEARAAETPGAKRAVIVAGPVHSRTDKYKAYAAAIADAAEAEGMEVTRIFHPNATQGRVARLANGADLFVYVGHGNGWPSPYGPFQEDTKNGLGLNPDDPALRTTSNVVYKGATWLRENIEFAPNAVVILSHLSYASGNASSGMPIPTREVAVERIDNYANGFLACGARAVWALGWQPGADVVRALQREDASMDAVFMTRYRSGINPLDGWIGDAPGYYDSVRVPGARIHIDPDPTYGYLRAVTGDLGFSTTEWRDSTTRPADVDPPMISALKVSQGNATIATDAGSPPVFTPNGDGISDTMPISFELSEGAFVQMLVKKADVVKRDRTVWATRGVGSLTWDGRKDNGKLAGEGPFTIVLTPTDRAGNRGDPASVNVQILNSMKSPSADPVLFYSADGDALLPSTTLRATITRDATVAWTIRDRSGAVVRRGPVADVTPGEFAFTWDGTDDNGRYVPQARYNARIRVTRPLGTYAHRVRVLMAAFAVNPSRWTVDRGDRVTLRITSAERLRGKPVVQVKQPGVPWYTVSPTNITKSNPTKFRATFPTRDRGSRGDLRIRITGTDKRNGTQYRVFKLTLR